MLLAYDKTDRPCAMPCPVNSCWEPQCVISSRTLIISAPSFLKSRMTATVRPCVQSVLTRHDTEGEWVITGTPTGNVRCLKTSGVSASRCGSPVRDSWTILSESQVEISYKAALTATPVTAPCSPDMGDEVVTNSPNSSPSSPSPAPLSVRPAKSSPKISTAPIAEVVESPLPASSVRGDNQSNAVAANVSSDEDFGYHRRKSRVAGSGSNKSRNNRKK